MPQDHDTWQWQKPGKAWRGIGIYHVTLVVPSREPLLGELIIPNNDPKQAYVEQTELGNALVDKLLSHSSYYPEVRILQFCLMPDHLHAILHVTHPMNTTFNMVVRSLWQGAKKLGRAYSSSISPESDSGLTNEDDTTPFSIFTERPFVRPLSKRGQLQTMIHYVQLNPQRLATKRLMPGFFRVQHDVEIAGRKYDAIGNIKILQAEQYKPVHVRNIWVDDAERHGDDTKLRDYKNGCIRAARQGAVMVSPFISPHEKAVLDYLLSEHHTIIYIADNGFGEYYKPASALFDAVAEGRMLILSPSEYDAGKKHVTRAECVAMNQMAEEICSSSINPESDSGK